ncbi:Vesicular glutamate transporter 2 [Trachymyrmex zeteki]|uniref:Vesicular glutamate transporter 2 n=1 Tax=Mycetomoellerius zeteki TaxID=64791 RepID=A0A151WS03_9HYME|nr:Vesicular glutamate transporter 2 [Trachymyrmex zeteki]
MPECPCLSKRYTIATLACVGFIISFGMRCNMGMAKLVMKNTTEGENNTIKFNWTIGMESALDSSFFWGYLVTQVPGGFLASLYPANRIFGTAIAISAFLNLLVPGALKVDPIVDMGVQVLKGLVEGVTYPACHGIWKYWAPPLERSRLATLAFCGSYAAMVIGMPLSGYLSFWFGWTASFYFYGICGLIWYGFWLWLTFEKPSKHPSISARELRYIEDSLGQGQTQAPVPTLATTPWRKFLTSMPVYAIIVANFCRSWNFYLLVLFQPRFMHESFGMPLVETGVIGSLPHLLMTMIVPCGGLLADYLRKRGIMTTTNVRKIFNCGGFGMEALFFLVVAHATTSKNGTAATVALAIGVACSGFAISGFNVNHLDIAPRYASILMGMSNGIGTIAGLLVPFFVDNITEKKDPHSWRNVFIIAACVHIFGVTFYAIFCSGELQPWADPTLEEQKSWNPMDEFSQTKPPVPPPPKTMQSEFILSPASIVSSNALTILYVSLAVIFCLSVIFRKTQKDPSLLDIRDFNSLRNSKFNKTHPTKVIIHGFGGGRNLAPSTDLRDAKIAIPPRSISAYFTRGDYNIIIVDYGSLVREPCLSQISWGPDFCSQCIAQLVKYLRDHPRGTRVENIHVLGYSVGAHIGGLIANYLPNDKLGRITGLDPTIFFYMNGNRSMDLDETDAHFVDVIHTGAGILGQWGPNGHADFYVNGGSSQPGCATSSILQLLSSGGKLKISSVETLSCDHTKVTPYYIESITTKKGFWAAPCANLFSYLIGWCNPKKDEYILMGEDSPHTARGIFYLSTNAHKPYARGLPVKNQRRTNRKQSSSHQY